MESEKLATVTELAKAGTKSQPKPPLIDHGRDPKEFAMPKKGQGLLRSFAEMSAHFDPAVVVQGAKDHEITAILRSQSVVRHFHFTVFVAGWASPKAETPIHQSRENQRIMQPCLTKRTVLTPHASALRPRTANTVASLVRMPGARWNSPATVATPVVL